MCDRKLCSENGFKQCGQENAWDGEDMPSGYPLVGRPVRTGRSAGGQTARGSLLTPLTPPAQVTRSYTLTAARGGPFVFKGLYIAACACEAFLGPK